MFAILWETICVTELRSSTRGFNYKKTKITSVRWVGTGFFRTMHTVYSRGALTFLQLVHSLMGLLLRSQEEISCGDKHTVYCRQERKNITFCKRMLKQTQSIKTNSALISFAKIVRYSDNTSLVKITSGAYYHHKWML